MPPPTPTAGRRRLRKGRILDQAGPDHLGDARRVLGSEAAHVVREVPQLFVGDDPGVDQVGERRHRRPVQTGAQPLVDVLDRAAAVEVPVLGQVRRVGGHPGVVDEGWRGGAIAPPFGAVTAVALDELVHLASVGEGFLGGARRAAEGQRVGSLAGGEEAGEALEVVDERHALFEAELFLPSGHGRARHAFVDDAHDVVVGGKLPARGGADLVERLGEVARARQHVGRRVAVAEALVAVAGGAPAVVDVAPERVLFLGGERDRNGARHRRGHLPDTKPGTIAARGLLARARISAPPLRRPLPPRCAAPSRSVRRGRWSPARSLRR